MDEKENGFISTKSYGTIPAKVSNNKKPNGKQMFNQLKILKQIITQILSEIEIIKKT